MDDSELCRYIDNYVKNNKTQTAIMLTGEWGIGKSYFIKEVLLPYLKDANADTQCVISSVYGLERIDELNKNIYWELRSLNIDKSKEGVVGGVILAKTLVRGVLGAVGINLTVDDDDLKKLYESIDLSNKLIVIEDIERSNLGVERILGYVNNLVEQDGAKILIVANESELIKKVKVVDSFGNGSNLKDTDESFHFEYTEDSQRYLRIKEKTISETIQYYGNHKTAVKNIISMYDNKALSEFSCDSNVKEIVEIMYLCKNMNLRSFVFACQKTVELFSYMKNEIDTEFKQCVFYSIIAYSLRTMRSGSDRWTSDLPYSFDYGLLQYPLFKFCYDYIWYQTVDIKKIEEAVEILKKIRLYDKNKSRNDKDINTISNYYREYEKNVIEAVDSISERLENEQDISFYDYGTIAAYLIIISHKLGKDISKAKRLMIRNLSGRGDNLEKEKLFRITLHNEEKSIRNEFDEFQKEVYKTIKKNEIIQGFEYLPEQSQMFYSYASDHEVAFHGTGKFAAALNIPKLIMMFVEASPSQKNDIRMAFQSVYRLENIKVFLANDKPYLEELRDGINRYCEDGIDDKIQQMQAQWFLANLEECIRKL